MTDFVGGGPRGGRFPSWATLIDVRPVSGVFCEGVSPKKSLVKIGEPCRRVKIGEPCRRVKIGEPSHTSTRFFATRFFQMPARGRGGKSEGAKKHHAFSRRSFFSDSFRGTPRHPCSPPPD